MVYDHYTIIKAGVCMNKKVRRVIFPHTYLKDQARYWKDEKAVFVEGQNGSTDLKWSYTRPHLSTEISTHWVKLITSLRAWQSRAGSVAGVVEQLHWVSQELNLRREDKRLFSPTNEQLTPPKVGNIVLPIVRRSVAVVLFTVRNRSPKQGASGFVKHKLGWSCWWSRKFWANQKLDDSPC